MDFEYLEKAKNMNTTCVRTLMMKKEDAMYGKDSDRNVVTGVIGCCNAVHSAPMIQMVDAHIKPYNSAIVNIFGFSFLSGTGTKNFHQAAFPCNSSNESSSIVDK